MQAHLLTSIALGTNTLWVWICPFGWASVGSSREVSPVLFMIILATLGPLNKNQKHPSAPSRHMSPVF